jgi:DNA mismatch repair protein MutS2
VPRPATTEGAAASALPPTVDLHGLTVEDALARVVEAIDAALRRGADRLEVVHGRGSGRIRDALHRHLTTMTVVASFRLDPRNPGVTWISF